MQDLLIIGGGINGAGIARDAAGRGLAVTLVEQGDPGGATSSASSKLLHGGLRYLEHYAFGLVAEALRERGTLLRTARHLARPVTFVLPHTPALRPAWMLRLGLACYDWLAGGDLPHAAAVDLTHSPLGAALRPEFRRGFSYADVQVDDARLVIANLVDARERGAQILDRRRFITAHRDGKTWRAQIANLRTGTQDEIAARCIVNAAGPWVDRVLAALPQLPRRGGVRLVRGSHIVVPRLYAGPQAYTLQNDDRRIVFLLPFCDAFTLIGTTETRVAEPTATLPLATAEIDYLCRAASRYTRTAVTPDKVVWSYAGVRPLYDDGHVDPGAVSREYVLQLDAGPPPVLSVFGGKLTTYRALTEKVLQRLRPLLPHAGSAWTAHAPLPGSEGDEALPALQQRLGAAYPRLAAPLIAGLVQRHGTRAERLLAGITDLGRDFGGGLTAHEVRHFIAHEWALDADDILWRRSKAGLFMSAAQRDAIADWLRQETEARR